MQPAQLQKLLSIVRKMNSILSMLNILLLLGPVECFPSVPGLDTHVFITTSK